MSSVKGGNTTGPADITTETVTTPTASEMQIVKLSFGASGTGTPATVVPVSDNGGSLTVDGTVSVTGVATQTTLASILSALQAGIPLDTATLTALETITVGLDAASLAALESITAVGPLTDAQLRATAVPVSGTVATGGLTDAELRATAVPVSGTVTANVGSGTQAVSGTVTANAGTGTLAVSNTVLSVVGTGTEAAAQRVTIATDSTGVLSVDDNGGSLTVDGTFWQATQPVSGTVTANLAAGTNNIGDVDVLSIAAGDNNIGNVDIVTMPNVTVGTMAALVAGTANIGDVDVLTLPAIPAGTNNIGDVDVLTVPADPFGANADAAVAAGATGSIQAKLRRLTTDIDAINTKLAGTLTVTGGGGGAEFAEDTAHSTGALGGMPLAVRNDAGTALAGTTGDYIPLTTDANGALYVTTAALSSATDSVAANPVVPSTSAVTSVNDTASSTTLLSSDSARKGFRIYNDSTSYLYVKYGTTASATDFTVKMDPGGYLEENHYYGRLDGIWSADASGAARITSLS